MLQAVRLTVGNASAYSLPVPAHQGSGLEARRPLQRKPQSTVEVLRLFVRAIF